MERGKFNNLAEHYDIGRRDYPRDVIDYFNALTENKGAYVLDMGSGTGIATRQLASSNRFVIGCEPSLEMVQVADQHPKSGISYVVGRVEQIPFENNSFDAMTVFSAFHWMMMYQKEKALEEIHRVLKPDGLLFVVSKRDTGTFSNDAYTTLRKYSSNPPSNQNLHDDVQQILLQSGFRDVNKREFEAIEQFTPEEALAQIQSMDDWNFVDDDKVDDAVDELKSDLNTKIQDGLINRSIELSVVLGRN